MESESEMEMEMQSGSVEVQKVQSAKCRGIAKPRDFPKLQLSFWEGTMHTVAGTRCGARDMWRMRIIWQ